jgi:hypothetical protein
MGYVGDTVQSVAAHITAGSAKPMQQMPLDLKIPAEYEYLQDVIIQHKLNTKLRMDMVKRIDIERDVVHDTARVALHLANGYVFNTTLDDLVKDETIATLILIGAGNADARGKSKT